MLVRSFAPRSRVFGVTAAAFALLTTVGLRAIAPDQATLWTDISSTALAAATTAVLALAVRHADDRRGWWWIAAASGSWLAGDLLSDITRLLALPTTIAPAPADVCFLAAAPLFIVGAATFLASARRRLALFALVLDVGAVSLVLLAGVALFVAQVFSEELPHDPLTTTIALLYPITYVAATGAALSTLWGLPNERARGAFVSVTIAMALDAAAFTVWLPEYIDRPSDAPAAAGPLWGLAMAVLGTAALQAIEDRARPHVSPRSDAVMHFTRLILPAVVAAAAALILVASQLDRTTSTDAIIAVVVGLTMLVLATRAGIALFSNYRLAEAQRRRAVQYEVLYDVGLEASNEHSVEELVRIIVDRATDLTACDGSSLALRDASGQYVFAALRKADERLRSSNGEPLRGIGLAALAAREIVVATDYALHASSTRKLHDLITSAMSAPLIVRGDAIGVVSVYTSGRRRVFSDESQRLFRLYAAQAAVAIETARLLEDSRVLARHDPLTGALNRRSLVERLEVEVAEARRHGDAFCVVMCDLDRLKEVNDAAGHLVGDAVLRRVAGAMREAARTEDSVARFGGDEFVLLLPRTSLLQGQALTARIGARLRELTYQWGGREEPLPRVSMGVAAFPDDGLTADALIAAADARMYNEKSRSRELDAAVATS